MFTAIDKTAASRFANLTCICSTKELLWIDDSISDTPALKWSHNQGEKKGDNVDILVIPGAYFNVATEHQSEVVVVYSRDSGSLQAVQISADRPTRLLALPWSPGGLPEPLFDLNLLPFQSLWEHRGSASIAGTTSDGRSSS